MSRYQFLDFALGCIAQATAFQFADLSNNLLRSDYLNFRHWPSVVAADNSSGTWKK